MSKSEIHGPAEEAVLQSERLTSLLDEGLDTLVRGGEPLITAPDFISQKGSDQLKRFRESYLEGRAFVSHVTARRVLKIGLTQVKHSKDEYGCWAAGIPMDFYLGVVGEIVGKKNAAPADVWKRPNTATQIFRKIDPMQRKVYENFDCGTLVEFGVIAVGENGNSAIASVSVPYEKPKGLMMEKSWWRKLSADGLAGFVGREAELAIFEEIIEEVRKGREDGLTVNKSSDVDLFGRPINYSKIARIYDQDDAKIWWGTATNLNNIVSLYAHDAHDRLNTASAGERIYADIGQQGFSRALQETVISPQFLTGYYIKLERDKDLSFRQVLHVDTGNWASFGRGKSKGVLSAIKTDK